MQFNKEFSYAKTTNILREISSLVAPEKFRERHGDYPWDNPHAMLDYSFDYSRLTSDDAIRLRQVHALYSKFEPLRLGLDKERVAYEKFWDSEAKCRETNRIFSARTLGLLYFRPDVEEQLIVAQRKIRMVLGDVPPLSVINLRFGPGANTTLKKQEASLARKLSAPLACSEELVPYLTEVLHELPMLTPGNGDTATATVEIHRGKLSFVPKNAKTYRSVVVEPMLNGLCQLGIGDYIARRLRKFGLDIRSQEANQRLARVGSLTNELATLDLSSASDSISTELVRFLLPHEWFNWLSRYRTQEIEYGGWIFRQHKFCSMGNGFTFPLETLIFWALAESAGKHPCIRAYGDDIIVPTKFSTRVVEVLTVCGFTLNSEKSYTEGPFRESCGADYLSGIDIRPIYVKELLSYRHLFRLYNGFREYFPEVASYILTEIPESLRLWGPPDYGDGHLVADSDIWKRPHRRKDGWGGWIFESYSTTPWLDIRHHTGDRILPAYSVYASHRDDEPNRRSAFDGRYDAVTFREAPKGLPRFRGKPFTTLPSGNMVYARISIYTFAN